MLKMRLAKLTSRVVPRTSAANERTPIMETRMQRLVSASKVIATVSTVRMLVHLPMHIVRRIAASPVAFINAIERFAKH
jgi:hypothetical protein